MASVKKGNKKKSKGKKKTHDVRTNEENMKIINKYFAHDPRGVHSTSEVIFASNQNPSMVLREVTDQQPFYAPGLAVVSYALSRNWQTVATNNSYPFGAFVYMGQALVLFAQGATPITSKVPVWFAEIINAVIRKEVPFAAGKINYNFEFSSGPNEDDQQLMGPSTYGRKFIMWEKDPFGGKVNFLIPDMVPPASYTPQLGEAAIQSLWTFLSSIHPDHAMHKMVAVNEQRHMTDDASAFAVNQILTGGGYAEVSSFAKLARLEVPVRTPIFSVFASTDQKGGQAYRYPNYPRNFAGDGIYLGTYLMQAKLKEMHFKCPPSFKFIDLNEFGNVIALWLKEAIQTFIDSNFFVQAQAADSTFINTLLCPLTIFELMSLLRNTLMIAFGESQLMGQAMYPRVPDRDQREFVSCVCGTGQVPVPTGAMMLLPFLLKENINSLLSRSNDGGRGGSANKKYWHPVLGIFEGDRLRREDYTVTYNTEGGTVTVPIFADDAGETLIDLVDGSYGTNQFAAISDNSYIKPITGDWNEYLQSRTDTFRNLATLGADPGINSLFFLFATRYVATENSGVGHEHIAKFLGKKDISGLRGKKLPWLASSSDDIEDFVRVPKGTKAQTKKEKKAAVEYARRMKKRFKKDIGTSPYANQAIIAYSVGGKLFKSTWTSVQQYWIAPVMKIAPPVGGAVSTDLYSMGALYREPVNFIPGTGSLEFGTLHESHVIYASLMIKSAFAASTDYSGQIMAEAEHGEAGMIGSLAKALIQTGGTVGGQVLGQVAENLIGI